MANVTVMNIPYVVVNTDNADSFNGDTFGDALWAALDRAISDVRIELGSLANGAESYFNIASDALLVNTGALRMYLNYWLDKTDPDYKLLTAVFGDLLAQEHLFVMLEIVEPKED